MDLKQKIVEIFIDSGVFEESAQVWKKYFKKHKTMPGYDNLKCIRKVLRETEFIDLILKEIIKEKKEWKKEKISGYEMIIEGQRIQIKALLK